MTVQETLDDALEFLGGIDESNDPYDLILSREQNDGSEGDSSIYQFGRAKTQNQLADQLGSFVRNQIENELKSVNNGEKEGRAYSASNISSHKEYIQYVPIEGIPRSEQYMQLITENDFPWLNYIDNNGSPPEFQAILARDGTDNRLLAFQDVTRSQVLARDGRIRFWSSADHYTEIDKTILEVPNRIDAIYYENTLLISDQRRFEKIFGYMDEFYQVAESTIESIVESEVPIHSSDKFLDAATSYPNAARLMYAVSERALWEHEAVNMDIFTHIIEEFDLSIKSEEIEGQRGIVMESLPQVWEVIRLYNDDYLNSPITEVNYQVSGKDAAAENDSDN